MDKIHDVIRKWTNTLSAKESYPNSTAPAAKSQVTKRELELAAKLTAAVEKELSTRVKFSKERPRHTETLFRHGIQVKPPKAPAWFVNECLKLNQGREMHHDKLEVNRITWPNLIIYAWKAKAQKPDSTKLHLLEELSKDRGTRSDLPAQYITGKPLSAATRIDQKDVRVALPQEVTKGLKSAIKGKNLFEWFSKGEKYFYTNPGAPKLKIKNLSELGYPEESNSNDKVVKHSLRVNGQRKNFTLKQLSPLRLPYFTYEAQMARKVERLGINTPHFHGYAEQNGATIAFFDHIDGKDLHRYEFTDEELKKFARHIAERHSKGIVQEDAALRNTMLDENGEYWMIDHESTKVHTPSSNEKEKRKFEKLRRAEIRKLKEEIRITNDNTNLFEREYKNKLAEFRQAA